MMSTPLATSSSDRLRLEAGGWRLEGCRRGLRPRSIQENWARRALRAPSSLQPPASSLLGRGAAALLAELVALALEVLELRGDLALVEALHAGVAVGVHRGAAGALGLEVR